jgi:hypothetical protein
MAFPGHRMPEFNSQHLPTLSGFVFANFAFGLKLDTKPFRNEENRISYYFGGRVDGTINQFECPIKRGED